MLIFIQESDLPGFDEPDVATKLQIFWDTFTWEIVKSRPLPPPRLSIGYFKLILPVVYSAHPPCSLRARVALLQKVRAVAAYIRSTLTHLG